MNSVQRVKEGDEITQSIETSNRAELIFFTNMQNAYKSRVCEFEDSKASVLGDYIPSALSMEQDETVICMAVTTDYSGHMVFFFENGRASRVPLSAYKTVTNRRRLINAYCDKFPIVSGVFAPADCDFALVATNNKAVILNTALIPEKSTKNTQGVIVFTQKGKNKVESVTELEKSNIANTDYYRTKSVPAVGHFLRDTDLKDTTQEKFE